MKISYNKQSERGSILLEFLGYGLLLQIFALVLFVQIANLQTYQLAAESIARHAIRSFVISETDPEVTANQILDDFGIDSKSKISMECKPDCFNPGSKLVLRVTLNSASAESEWIK